MNQGERGGRVVQDLFFCNSKQIFLAQQFVSCFVNKIDATFNTNERRMPLSILVGILNTGKNFSFAFWFIISEAASQFEFIEAKLDKLFFYNSLCTKVICDNFAKVLAKAIATQETQRHAEGNNNTYILQLFERQKVEAIKQHLAALGSYSKVDQDKIIDFTWK